MALFEQGRHAVGVDMEYIVGCGPRCDTQSLQVVLGSSNGDGLLCDVVMKTEKEHAIVPSYAMLRGHDTQVRGCTFHHSVCGRFYFDLDYRYLS